MTAKATTYGVSAPTVWEAQFVANRFATPAVEGPMASPRTELIARSIAELLAVGGSVRVDGPVVPIDPISMRPDYEQADPRVYITTTIQEDTVFGAFQAQEAAVMAEVERTN